MLESLRASRYDAGCELDTVLWMKTPRRGRPLRRPARIELLVAAGCKQTSVGAGLCACPLRSSCLRRVAPTKDTNTDKRSATSQR
jgi:hypothetical protein